MLALDSRAAHAMADYHLAVGFDLATATVRAVADIEIPAGEGLDLNLDELTVGDIQINDQPLAIPKDRVLKLASQPTAQRLVIHYQKSFAGSPDNLVGPEGIALTGLWHPLPSRDCRFHLQVNLPPGFEAVTEADRIDREQCPVGSIMRCTLAQPLPSVSLVAGPYVVTEARFGDNQTLYTYFFPEDKELAASYRDKALAYLKRYQELIGPYPYQRFSIVENRLPTGYAMPGFTLLGQSVARLPFITDTSLGHEILHSWFGNAIRVDPSQGNWCEGLTTYLADQAYAADRGEGPSFRRDELLKYQHYVHPDTAIPVKDFQGAAPGQEVAVQAQRAVGYGKAAMIFRMLENRIGHRRFVEGLRRLYQTKNGRLASWSDLQAAFEAGGESLSPFFEQWLNRSDVPRISADKIGFAEKDGVPTLTFTLHQGTDTPYHLQVPVAVVSATGLERRQVTTDGIDQVVTMALSREPTTLVLDPDYDLMRVPATTEAPPSWDWFQGTDKRLAVVNSTADYDLFQPFIEQLEAGGVKIVAANEVTNADLEANALIFLGTSGPAPRSLFANPNYPERGLTVDIRQNPLNPLFPAVLMTASSQAELLAGLSKLGHYGKYGYLHFEGGRALDKVIRPAGFGINYNLEDEPTAITAASAQSFVDLMAQLAGKRVIYVGESHTRYEDHKLQLKLIRELFEAGQPLVIGMEMFPQASQAALDDFIARRTSEAEFLKQSKYFDVWRFDYRLYREILNFARAQAIPVIALNTDRDKVSKVFSQGGTAALSPEEKAQLPADRDLDLPGYRQRIHEVYTMHPGRDEKGFSGFLQSQSIWDETMAQAIVDSLAKYPERRMVVLAGNGHVVKDNAIPPRVSRRLPGVAQAVVMSSDGLPFSPSETDYLVFMPPTALPPPALMGVVMGTDKGKVSISEVAAGSPAAKAGIRKGDTLLDINGTAVASAEDVKIILLDKKVGDTIRVTVRRPQALFGDQDLHLALTL